MSTFEMIEAKRYHCGQIVHRLRHRHLEALSRLGRSPHKELLRIFDDSACRNAWLLNGRLAAIAGVSGTLISPLGYAWLAISEEATAHPVALIREIRRHMNTVMSTRDELATTIIGGDEGAKRLAVFLGFHVEDEGDGAPAVSKSGRMTLAGHLDNTPDLRIPVGTGYVIGMGYHHEAE